MYQTDQFDGLLDRAIKGVLAHVDEAEWRAYEKMRRNSGNGWKPDLPDNPKPGPYEPTGYAGFDGFIAKLNPRFEYGGNGPRTSVANATVGSAAIDQMGDDGNARTHWLDLPDGALSITLPNAADFDNSYEYASSLAHELIHWAENHDPQIVVAEIAYAAEVHGEARVGGLSQKDASKLSGSVGDEAPKEVEDAVQDPPYVMAEFTAELGAMLLLAATGVDPNVEDRVHYMQGYMGAVPPMFRDKVMDECRDRAKKAVAALLQHAA